MINPEDAIAPTAITNYIMTNVILRVSQDINPAEVEKLDKAIKAHLPDGAHFSKTIWFNPENGMEWPDVQISDDNASDDNTSDVSTSDIQTSDVKTSDVRTSYHPIDYLQDRKNRVQSIYSGIVYLLTSLDGLVASDDSVTCLRLITLKFKKTILKLNALAPIDDLRKLKSSKMIISKFTHFSNVVLYPILAAPGVNFLPDKNLSVSNLKKVQKLLDHAETFSLASVPREIVCTISRSDNNKFAIDIAIPQPSYIVKTSNNQKKNILEQYKISESEKLSVPFACMLDNLIKIINEKPEQLYVASSRADNLPGIRNRWQSGNLILNEDGEKVFYSENDRMAHISSRSKEISHDQIVKNATNNLEQVIEEQIRSEIEKDPGENVLNINIPFSTLITPLRGFDIQLEEDKNLAIKILLNRYKNKKIKVDDKEYVINLNIFSLNNAVNYGRTVLSASFSGEYKRFFEAAVHEFTVRTKLRGNSTLKNLLIELKDALENKKISNDYNRELHVAALVRVISNLLGWPVIGGCISGKDREALRDIYRKSIEEYIVNFRRVPKLSDIDKMLWQRKDFVDIFTRRYLSGHEQYLAQKNAEGARGTKTPDIYLPTDIQEAITFRAGNSDILEYSELLAALNDIKKMHMPSQQTPWNNAFTAKAFAQIKEEITYFQFLFANKLQRQNDFILGRRPLFPNPDYSPRISFFQDSRDNNDKDNKNDNDEKNRCDTVVNNAFDEKFNELKDYLEAEIQSGKYDQFSGTVISDKNNKSHRVPQTLARVYLLINNINDYPYCLDVKFEELQELSRELSTKVESVSITRKGMIRTLYDEISPKVTLLHQLYPIYTGSALSF